MASIGQLGGIKGLKESTISHYIPFEDYIKGKEDNRDYVVVSIHIPLLDDYFFKSYCVSERNDKMISKVRAAFDIAVNEETEIIGIRIA